jgi:hypothetical protein
MYESASPIGSIIDPIPFIKSEVFPYLFSFSVTHSVVKLSDIPHTILESDRTLRDKWRHIFIIIFERSQSGCNLSGAFVVEILRFETIVLSWIDNKCVDFLCIGCGAGFTLIAHSCFFSVFKLINYISYVGITLHNKYDT